MREYLAMLLLVLSISSSYAQLPLNVVSDFFQQNPRFATGFVLGIIIMAVAKSTLTGFFQNEQDRNRIAVALGVGTIILFQFAVPEFVTTGLSNYMTWAIIGTIGIIFLTMMLKKGGAGISMSFKTQMFSIGIIMILIAMLLEFLGVTI